MKLLFLPTSSPQLFYHLCLYLSFLHAAQAASNFEQCFADLQQSGGNITGGTDNNGLPVAFANATGMTYARCVESCGSGQEAFDWGGFSQQFSSWLLPWLALISQLPFGAILPRDNLVSVFLAVGSPALAAYSLTITALNGQWVTLRFSKHYHLPNVQQVVRILRGLQQAPLRVPNEYGLLSSLVNLRENYVWFEELAQWIKFQHTWSISAASSIGWVLVAYLFTVADSFADVTEGPHSNGQAVGAILLWLPAVVVGWLQLAPKIEATRLNIALEKANKPAQVVTETGTIVPADRLSRTKRAFSLATYDSDFIVPDELATAPIFNYARFLPWVQAVEEVAAAYHDAAQKRSRSTAGAAVYLEPLKPHEAIEQVTEYYLPVLDVAPPTLIKNPAAAWGPGVFERFLVASAAALALQWTTTGSAILIHWWTPTRELGCRSGPYMAYGVIGTVVWIVMVFSSFLSHAAQLRYTRHCDDSNHTRPATWRSLPLSVLIMKITASLLRRFGKVLATLNALGLILVCIFQFSNFFNTCWCNSTVMYWRDKAFTVIIFEESTKAAMKGGWIGGLCLALLGVFGFVGFINLYIDPALPDVT